MEGKLNQKIIFSKKLENIYRDNSIQPICSKLFSEIKAINYFGIYRFYDDGNNFVITNDPEHIKHFYAEGLYPTVSELEEMRKVYGSPKKLHGFYSKESAMTDNLKAEEKNKYISRRAIQRHTTLLYNRKKKKLH
jgi:hypothetical protein